MKQNTEDEFNAYIHEHRVDVEESRRTTIRDVLDYVTVGFGVKSGLVSMAPKITSRGKYSGSLVKPFARCTFMTGSRRCACLFLIPSLSALAVAL